MLYFICFFLFAPFVLPFSCFVYAILFFSELVFIFLSKSIGHGDEKLVGDHFIILGVNPSFNETYSFLEFYSLQLKKESFHAYLLKIHLAKIEVMNSFL